MGSLQWHQATSYSSIEVCCRGYKGDQAQLQGWLLCVHATTPVGHVVPGFEQAVMLSVLWWSCCRFFDIAGQHPTDVVSV